MEDRPLTEAEKQQYADTGKISMGNGVRPSFADLPPETVREYQRRAQDTMRRNKALKAIATAEGYAAVARENASTAMLAHLSILEGLLDEMRVVGEDGTIAYDTRLMQDPKRLKLLMEAANTVEKAAGYTAAKKAEKTVTVDVTKALADLQKGLLN